VWIPDTPIQNLDPESKQIVAMPGLRPGCEAAAATLASHPASHAIVVGARGARSRLTAPEAARRAGRTARLAAPRRR